jgi:hypothetical protein
MEVIQVAVKLQFRRDTAANWESNNTILSEGELGLDTTNERFKIGDGVNGWNALDNAQYTNKAETLEFNIEVLVADWTLQTSGDWDGLYIATKTLTGVFTTDAPIFEIDLSTATASTLTSILADYGFIFRVETSSINTVQIYALDIPTQTLKMKVKVIR